MRKESDGEEKRGKEIMASVQAVGLRNGNGAGSDMLVGNVVNGPNGGS